MGGVWYSRVYGISNCGMIRVVVAFVVVVSKFVLVLVLVVVVVGGCGNTEVEDSRVVGCERLGVFVILLLMVEFGDIVVVEMDGGVVNTTSCSSSSGCWIGNTLMTNVRDRINEYENVERMINKNNITTMTITFHGERRWCVSECEVVTV